MAILYLSMILQNIFLLATFGLCLGWLLFVSSGMSEMREEPAHIFHSPIHFVFMFPSKLLKLCVCLFIFINYLLLYLLLP